METKRTQAIRHLDGKGALPIIEVFYEFNHLKALYRQGWLKRPGEIAICAPNHVSLQIAGRAAGYDSLAY